MISEWSILSEVAPADHAQQVTSWDMIADLMTRTGRPRLVVDLGCGDASSAKKLRALHPGVQWIGVDVTRFPDADPAERIVVYDGVHLPFADDSVPLIYSNQVFEHVRHPEQLLADIRRVLSPGGLFVGSTSQLEPYHALSMWNYTFYGFKTIVEDAGLQLLEMRPGIDGMALIRRQLEGATTESDSWFVQSPGNADLDVWAESLGHGARALNMRKIHFCGQFAFKVAKSVGTAQSGTGPTPGRAITRVRRRMGAMALAAGVRLLAT